MPELPEVETVVRELNSELALPETLNQVTLLRGDLRNKFPRRKLEGFVGRKLKGIVRRSKYLLFEFEGEGGILSHLGMTGHWRVDCEKFEQRTHDHIRLHFQSGHVLIYNDPRRFGFFDVYENPQTHKLLKDIGPEPFSEDFNATYLKTTLKKRSGPIKNLLMNQHIVAGVGNIYASEVLFRAGVRPTRPGGRVSLEECAKIVEYVRLVLQESITHGGSSFDDFRHVSGESGQFQDRFQVYDRHNQECVKCGRKISKKVQAGRSTYWCVSCQK